MFNIAYFIICYLVVIIIHEIGHAIFVKIFGGKIIYIGFGEGDPLFEYKKFKIGKKSLLSGGCIMSLKIK